jgi:hypothetical protein
MAQNTLNTGVWNVLREVEVTQLLSVQDPAPEQATLQCLKLRFGIAVGGGACSGTGAFGRPFELARALTQWGATPLSTREPCRRFFAYNAPSLTSPSEFQTTESLALEYWHFSTPQIRLRLPVCPVDIAAPFALHYREDGALQVDADYDTAGDRYSILLRRADCGIYGALARSCCGLVPYGTSTSAWRLGAY